MPVFPLVIIFKKIVKKKKGIPWKIFVSRASGIFVYGQRVNYGCSSLEIILQPISREA